MRLLAAVLLAGPLLAAPVPKGLKKTGNFMPLEVGCKWEYVEAGSSDVIVDTREITAVEQKDGVTFATQKLSGITQVFRADATGVAVVRSNNGDYAHPRYVVKNEMKAGDEWEWDAGGYTERRTVGTTEKVTTPAGEFEAVKLTYRTEQNGAVGSDITVWYAAGVGLVRIDYTNGRTSHVLKAFTSGKK
ncbi:MAG: hypothetical protein ABGY75_09250 [Gemmataceae bacterium]